MSGGFLDESFWRHLIILTSHKTIRWNVHMTANNYDWQTCSNLINCPGKSALQINQQLDVDDIQSRIQAASDIVYGYNIA